MGDARNPTAKSPFSMRSGGPSSCVLKWSASIPRVLRKKTLLEPRDLDLVAARAGLNLDLCEYRRLTIRDAHARPL